MVVKQSNNKMWAMASLWWLVQGWVWAQVMSMGPDRLVSPLSNSGFGYVRIPGQQDVLLPHVDNVDVRNTAHGFRVKVKSNYGGLIDAFLTYRSKAGGTWKVTEKLVARKALETEEIGTGLIGILNDPHWIFERGQRTLTLDGRPVLMPSGSGMECRAEVNRMDVDGCMSIRSKKPLHMVYRAATKSDHCRFSDMLYLNYIGERRIWNAGEVLSTFSATVSFSTPSKPCSFK